MIVTHYQDGVVAALFDGRRPVELAFEEDGGKSLLGNIYVGRVASISRNINAAFVEVGDGVMCYYSLKESKDPIFVRRASPDRLMAGDELLVQVAREGTKSKAPTVTSDLALPGRFLVLTTAQKRIAASSKLPPETRQDLLEMAGDLSDPRFGWIVRTNAAGVEKEELHREAARLRGIYESICKKAPHSPCRSCLFQSPPQWLLRIRDIYDGEYGQILTDDAGLYRQMRDYLQETVPSALKKLSFYQDALLPLAKRYAVEQAFEEAKRERVWLKSGAYLVIQETEALTVIDVNTGKCERGKHEDFFYQVNLEAAHEIARQLRLRNLSGIILIDFINMQAEEQNRSLMRALDADLKNDPVKACVIDMTKLGLVEVTRKRVQKTLAEKTGEKV